MWTASPHLGAQLRQPCRAVQVKVEMEEEVKEEVRGSSRGFLWAAFSPLTFSERLAASLPE